MTNESTAAGTMRKIIRAANTLQNQNQRFFRELGLTKTQANVLHFIACADTDTPVHARDIEKEFGVCHVTVSNLIHSLENKGFVELITDPRDKRQYTIHRTPRAVSITELLSQRIQQQDTAFSEKYTEEEMRLLSTLLARIE